MSNGVLFKGVVVRVRDVSVGGCLIESPAALPVGTIGLLEAEFEGERRIEWFRISRVNTVHGQNGAWLAGAEFLPFAVAEGEWLRGAVGRLRQFRDEKGMAGSAGRSSGDSWKSVAERAGNQARASQESADLKGNIVEFSPQSQRLDGGHVVATSIEKRKGAPATMSATPITKRR